MANRLEILFPLLHLTPEISKGWLCKDASRLSAVASAETHCETAALETAKVIKTMIIANNCAMLLPISFIFFPPVNALSSVAATLSNVYASAATLMTGRSQGRDKLR